MGILRALYALISAYNHLSELQNEVTATRKSDNHISANICAFQIQKFFVMEVQVVQTLTSEGEAVHSWYISQRQARSLCKSVESVELW